ncbi:uncharacterized protein VDAG_06195 [Verticillium dahliae VdLs.17]|uniref:Uncharacterized protein n=1 Tax=Verticillium dahliae (strain VdLs.17 / ATCC MYA-4575 / FGSC 10137) TaxID=498257 RepID=G2X8Q4_VERDV|nr:uncharacterized protein VDAG_06195 [Verticillium dahliae VdLs.17]EGY15341.1 hypothetical protein VDAG_06195 [Verticillium dahliae VdLs.17]
MKKNHGYEEEVEIDVLQTPPHLHHHHNNSVPQPYGGYGQPAPEYSNRPGTANGRQPQANPDEYYSVWEPAGTGRYSAQSFGESPVHSRPETPSLNSAYGTPYDLRPPPKNVYSSDSGPTTPMFGCPAPQWPCSRH